MATYQNAGFMKPITNPPYQSIVDDAPTQPTSSMYEFKASRTITEDVQRATIVHEFLIEGETQDAFNHEGLGNLEIGDVHPWFRSTDRNAYLVRRTFEPHVLHGSDGTPITKATFVFHTRPCLRNYEEEYNTTLVSMMTWWGYEALPKRLVQYSWQGIPIDYPQTVYTRYYPIIQLSEPQVQRIMDSTGTVDSDGWMGAGAGQWLFESAKAKLLSGKVGAEGTTQIGYWELLLQFRRDKWRRHKEWRPNLEIMEGVMPSSNTLEALEAFHKTQQRYRIATIPFDDLVPVRFTQVNCVPNVVPGE